MHRSYYGLVWRASSLLDNPLTYTYTSDFALLALHPELKLGNQLITFTISSASNLLRCRVIEQVYGELLFRLASSKM